MTFTTCMMIVLSDIVKHCNLSYMPNWYSAQIEHGRLVLITVTVINQWAT